MSLLYSPFDFLSPRFPQVREALNVPSDLDPSVLVPILYTSQLVALGYSEELSTRALARCDNDFAAAAEWLAANAKFFAEQSEMMAELDAAVLQSAVEKRKAESAPAVRCVPCRHSFVSTQACALTCDCPVWLCQVQFIFAPDRIFDSTLISASLLRHT